MMKHIFVILKDQAFTPVRLCFREFVGDVTGISQASGLQDLQSVCTGMEDQTESQETPFLSHKVEFTSESKYMTGEFSDIENNGSYLNQDECMTETSIKRETSTQPLLEMAPMTGN